MIATIKGLVQLARPVNTVITVLSVLVAAFIAGPLEPLPAVILAGLSAGIIMAGANTINDYYDVVIDRINKPRRPLAAGLLSRRTAWFVAVGEFALGILLAALISPPMLGMALLFSGLIYWYSAHLKRTVLWGNLAVSLSTAAAFIYGGLAVNHPREALLPALFAFFFHFGREILKDLEDLEGDRLGQAHTFAVRYGSRPAILLISLNFLLLAGLTALPYLAGWYSPLYFGIILLGIYPVILYTCLSIRINTHPRHLEFLSKLLKFDMLVGLLAIYFR